MTILRITKFGERVLRKKSNLLKDFGPKTQKLIQDMYETMYAANGIGLAGPQVDVPFRIAVVNVTPEDKKKQFVMINPEIIKKDTKADSEEGCLSLPGLGATNIKRFKKVVVRALDQKGQPFEIKGDGLLARCLQHEIDHLNGTMIINRSSLKRQFQMRMDLRKLKKQGLW